MVFSDFYKSPRSSFSKMRQHPKTSSTLPASSPDWDVAEYADLLDKVKTKQKEAIKRYLAEKVRNDWSFEMHTQSAGASSQSRLGSRAQGQDLGEQETKNSAHHVQDETRDDDGYQVDEGSGAESPTSVEGGEEQKDDDDQSVYSLVSEDEIRYRTRLYSISDDDDAPARCSPGRRQSAETTSAIAKDRATEIRGRRRRLLRTEMAWNTGLAFFEARRDAWTGAKTVRVRSKPLSPAPTSPRSPRRFFYRSSHPNSPSASISSPKAQTSDISDASSKDNDKDSKRQGNHCYAVTKTLPPSDDCPVETLVPVGQPLLPPTNSLRASITPAIYLSLYDKVVMNSLQPACPVNLADMLRSCVAGWKRDGDWTPRAPAADPGIAARKPKKTADNEHGGNTARRLSFGFLGRERDDDTRMSKSIRRSLQRALGIGVTAGSDGGGGGHPAKEA